MCGDVFREMYHHVRLVTEEVQEVEEPSQVKQAYSDAGWNVKRPEKGRASGTGAFDWIRGLVTPPPVHYPLSLSSITEPFSITKVPCHPTLGSFYCANERSAFPR